jgi:hypothetical protein
MKRVQERGSTFWIYIQRDEHGVPIFPVHPTSWLLARVPGEHHSLLLFPKALFCKFGGEGLKNKERVKGIKEKQKQSLSREMSAQSRK